MTRLHGALLIVGATFCWSTGGILIRSVSADVWTTVFWRSLVLAVVLGGYLLLRHGRGTAALFRAIGIAGVVSSLLIAASFVLFLLAIANTLVANAMVIMSSAPLVSAVLGRIFLGERVKPLTIAAIGVALGGIGVMVWGNDDIGQGSASLIGSLCAFGVALTWGANIVVVRAARGVDLLPAMSLAGVLAALAVLPAGGAIPMFQRTTFGLMALMGTVQLALGSVPIPARRALFARGGSRPAGALLETVLAPLWVWIGVGEVPTLSRRLIGGGIVISAHSQPIRRFWHSSQQAAGRHGLRVGHDRRLLGLPQLETRLYAHRDHRADASKIHGQRYCGYRACGACA